MPAEQIKVYVTAWCPDSNRTRKFLNEHNIPFELYDITDDKEACAYVEKVNRGNRSVPTILFPDGSILVEPSNAKLQDKLVALGLTSP